MRPNDPFQSSRLRKAPYLRVALWIAIYHIGSLWFGDMLLARAPRLMAAFRGVGIDVPVFVVFGPRYWPVLLGIFFTSSLSRGMPWLPSCGLAIACVLRTLISAWVFRRVSGMKKRLAPFEDLAGVIGAGLTGPVISAALGTACLVVAGKTPVSWWGVVAGQWWASDFLGMLAMTPVLIGAARWWSDKPDIRRSWRGGWAVLYLAAVAVICYFIFFRTVASYLLFSVFLLILIAANWLGPTSARFAALVIASMATWATHDGVGAFAGQTLSGNLLNLALFLTAVSVTGMAVGPFRSFTSLALPSGVLVVGWALSGWLYASMDRDRTRYDSARLDEVIGSVENRINNRFQTYEKVLWGGAGYLAASGKISPKDWHTYVARLHLLDGDPGTTAMAIVQPVPDTELDSFVRTHQGGEWPAFRVHRMSSSPDTSGSPAEHFLVVCAEPAAVGARSIGADLALEPARRAAAEQARDSGAAVLTSTTLGDRSGKALQLFVPVYREGAPVTTAEERRAALVAWVTVVFRAETVFRAALGELEPGLALRVYHGDQPAPAEQFFVSDTKVLRAPERLTHLSLGQKTWTLGWTRLVAFPYLSKAPSAWAAGCTALLSLLLAWLVMTLQATKRKATDRLKLIESASSLGTWELDVASQTLHCSEEMLRLYGIKELRERLPLEEWLSYVHPDDREAMRAEILSRRADRESVDLQYRVVWRDGSVHWLHSRALPVGSEQGRHSRIVGVDFDISEVKQLQSQLAQAQKLESVGQLAAGVAHEINTPIQYVGDNAKFLEDAFRELIRASAGSEGSGGSLRPEPKNGGDLEYLRKEVPVAITEMQEGLGQVARIVRAMKEFSHPGPIDMAAVDINQAIESTVLVSKHEWKFVAELTTDLDPALPMVPCVAGELNQVILNLIVNAAHAIGDTVKDSGRKGQIQISTRQRDEAVEVRVADTGTGIPQAIQSRVFDPFFTTKPVGKGTGQGLAIAHTVVVQKHKGKLHFETEPGRGTTFIIELPLVQELEPA